MSIILYAVEKENTRKNIMSPSCSTNFSLSSWWGWRLACLCAESRALSIEPWALSWTAAARQMHPFSRLWRQLPRWGSQDLLPPSGGSPAKRARGCICVEDADQLNAQGSKLKAMTLTAIMLNRKFPSALQTTIGTCISIRKAAGNETISSGFPKFLYFSFRCFRPLSAISWRYCVPCQ